MYANCSKQLVFQVLLQRNLTSHSNNISLIFCSKNGTQMFTKKLRIDFIYILFGCSREQLVSILNELNPHFSWVPVKCGYISCLETSQCSTSAFIPKLVEMIILRRKLFQESQVMLIVWSCEKIKHIWTQSYFVSYHSKFPRL